MNKDTIFFASLSVGILACSLAASYGLVGFVGLGIFCLAYIFTSSFLEVLVLRTSLFEKKNTNTPQIMNGAILAPPQVTPTPPQMQAAVPTSANEVAATPQVQAAQGRPSL